MGKKRGLLVFKGDKPKKKNSKSKHRSSETRRATDEFRISPEEQASHEGAGLSASSAVVHDSPDLSSASSVAAAAPPPRIEQGNGRITSSGTAVSGHGTTFQSEFRAGDAIIVSISGRDEMRVVTMLLSGTSLGISTPFSINLKSPTDFRFIKKPRDVGQERASKVKKEKEEKAEVERSAFGTYGAGELVYRERTEHGSYRIRREAVEGNVGRGDLLEMRTKKKSDKYC